MRFLAATVVAFAALPALADAPDIPAIVETHVIQGYERLADETSKLASAAIDDCTPSNTTLLTSYHDAFDAWIGVSHLRFGPSEQEDRAFALAFWPDPRGSTPKTLGALISDADPVIDTPKDFGTVSVAARGFYALEFLLFEPTVRDAGDPLYRCNLTRAITQDIAANSLAILDDWQNGYGDLMSKPGNTTYRTETEAAKQLFTALVTGLEFTSQARLGRPIGTFDRPRPNRAEARRSGRSLRHVVLSLEATKDLALQLSTNDPDVQAAFDTVLKKAKDLDDPVFSNVSDPQERFRVEALQQSVDKIRQLLGQKVGAELGIAAGFNALDGD